MHASDAIAECSHACVLDSPLTAATLRRLVVEAPSFDLSLISAVVFLLAAGAFLSAYGPARRAGRVNTAELLKAE